VQILARLTEVVQIRATGQFSRLTSEAPGVESCTLLVSPLFAQSPEERTDSAAEQILSRSVEQSLALSPTQNGGEFTVKNFSQKPIVRIAVVLSILAVAGAVALSAAGHTGIVTSQDGRMSIATHPAARVTPAASPDTTLTVIAGNLSKYPNGVYFCCYGFTISGPTSFLGTAYWIAIPFTPTSNYTVNQLRASVAWGQSGTEGVTLSLNADANGLPGSVLFGRNLTSLGDFGACCTLAIASDSAGVPITAGTQYWVVASTSASTSSTYDAWAFNSTDMRSYNYAAYNSQSGTWSAGQGLLPGYEVLGQ
jgi:hypothetical protein